MSLPSGRLLEQGRCGGVTRARLNVTSLGESEVGRIGPQLLGLAAGGVQDLRLDLGPVEYLTSDGLGLFLALNERVRAGGGRLSLHNVGDLVYEVFAVTRLTTVLDVRPQGA
jgi:anti-anti-sigma factor